MADPRLRPDPRPRAATAMEAEALVHAALEHLERLAPIIALETDLMKAGRLREALALGEDKAATARAYGQAMEDIRANAVALGRFRPPALALLRSEHERFNALLELNMAVLATAKTVAEGLLRELAGAASDSPRPQGYGANGRGSAPVAGTPRPLAVARSL